MLRKVNIDKILAISAIFISLVTLVIFVYQTNLLRKQNYISILPYLMVSMTRDGATNTYEVNIKNHGVGPGIIESVEFHYKGSTYQLHDYNDDIFAFLISQNPTLDTIKNVSYSSLNSGLAIPANSSYNLFSISGSPGNFKAVDEKISTMLENGFDYTIVYKSILDEKWKIHVNSDSPELIN